jgi:hypothetical protein
MGSDDHSDGDRKEKEKEKEGFSKAFTNRIQEQ